MVDVLTPNQRSALNRALKHKELLPLLFRKVDGLFWFDAFKDENLLEPECNPPPKASQDEGYYQIPTWPITEYLVSSSANLKDFANEEYALKYREVLRDTTLYAKCKGYSNYRTWWQFSKIIKNLPIKILEDTDIDIVEYWLSDKFEKGIIGDTVGAWLIELIEIDDHHAKDLSYRLLNTIFQIEFRDKKVGSYEKKEAVLLFYSYKLSELTNKISKSSGVYLKERAVIFFREMLEDVLSKLEYDEWSSIRRSAIEEHEQNHERDDADDIAINCFRNSLQGYFESDLPNAEIYLNDLFCSDYQIINRIAIYIADKEFVNLSVETLEKVLVDKYFNDKYRHEIWNFLSNNFNSLTDAHKKIVIGIIEHIVEYGENGEVSDKYTAYEQLIWLSAIRDHSADVAQLYNERAIIAGAEPENPGFSSYSTTAWVGYESPIKLEDLRLLDTKTLVKALNDYRSTSKNSGFREPSIEGLASTFRELIKIDAGIIYKDLDELVELDAPYLHSLIDGFSDLWVKKDETNLPWDNVWPILIKYINSVVCSNRFWGVIDGHNNDAFVFNHHWIVGSIGRLLEAGCKSDDHSFGVENISESKSILELLLSREAGDKFQLDSDAVSISINSPRGHCLEAIINLALFACRNHSALNITHEEVWAQYLPILNLELHKADEVNEYEFATLVAHYLHNFMYLSKEWSVSNLSIIFDQQNYQRWLCAMQGYSYVNRPHPEVYEYMKNSGDLIKVLDDENVKDRVDNRYIQFIVLAYIVGDENLDDDNSQISILIERKNYDELQQIIWFIWTFRDNTDLNLKAKVYELWPKLLDYIDDETKEGRKLASQLCQWAVYVDDVDDVRKQWLLRIAPFAEADYNSHDLIEVIAKLSVNQPFEMQEIWLALLKEYSYDYPDSAIKEALSNLVAQGQRGLIAAKEVVSTYLKHGLDRPTEWLNELRKKEG